jgi:hypothetical protein
MKRLSNSREAEENDSQADIIIIAVAKCFVFLG